MNKNLQQKQNELLALRERLLQEQQSYLKDYIHVGDFTYGKPNVLSWGEGASLYIGKFCSIAENVTILLGGNHRTDWVTTYPFNALMNAYSFIKGHPATKGDVRIGNDVWIGNGAKILSGVTISDGAVIGGNAVVSKDVPPYSICVGNPAQIVKMRFDKKTVKRLLALCWWDWNDEDLVAAIPLLQSEQLNKLFDYAKDHNL